MENITSEQELKQLLEDGKISEDEYGELFETMQRRPQAESGNTAPANVESVRTSGLAIASLVMALALGPVGVIPAVICGHVALRRIERDASLSGRGLALAGLIVGYCNLGLTIVMTILFILPMLAYHKAETYQKTPTQKYVVPKITSDAIELKQFALDDTNGLITQTGIVIDKEISSDGNGSLRIETDRQTTTRLFETGDIDIENARLFYQAKVRTENAEGNVYLEMWCHFPGKGEFFSKGLAAPLTGTTEWTTLETPFLLKKGQNPDNIKLNLVVDGKGTAWIDDIRLLKGPL